MNKSAKGSAQLMLTLFVLGLTVILFANYNRVLGTSFVTNIVCIAAAAVISIVYFVPSAFIRAKSQTDLIGFTRRLPIGVKYFSSIFYSVYFVWLTVYALISYGDLFITTANPTAWKPAIVLIILAAGIYSACKGFNGITRCAVFVFIFSLVTFVVIFSGNISKLDFEINSLISEYNGGTPFSVLYAFMQLGFPAVVFGMVSGKTGNFKIKHIIFTLAAVGVAGMVSVFFISFVLGSYGANQNYRFYALSKTAETISSGGTDSFYLALCAMVIFILISISLYCTTRAACADRKNYLTISFGVIVFVLYLCANSFSYVKEVLTSAVLFDIFTFLAAVLIPTIYIFVFRRKLSV